MARRSRRRGWRRSLPAAAPPIQPMRSALTGRRVGLAWQPAGLGASSRGSGPARRNRRAAEEHYGSSLTRTPAAFDRRAAAAADVHEVRQAAGPATANPARQARRQPARQSSLVPSRPASDDGVQVCNDHFGAIQPSLPTPERLAVWAVACAAGIAMAATPSPRPAPRRPPPAERPRLADAADEPMFMHVDAQPRRECRMIRAA